MVGLDYLNGAKIHRVLDDFGVVWDVELDVVDRDRKGGSVLVDNQVPGHAEARLPRFLVGIHR